MTNLMTSLFILSLLVGLDNSTKTVERNGMTVQWQVTATELQIRMSAPTQGWVAVGLNPNEHLMGTSLLMGRIQNANPEVEDFYVLSPGNYKPVTELGGESQVTLIEGSESPNGTYLHFSIPLEPDSEWHYALQAGKAMHLLMAYSRSDDFENHSMMRTSVLIEL